MGICGLRRRTAIAATAAAPAVDPLIEPFLTTHLNYREAIANQVRDLTDEELDKVADLFHHQSLRDIPYEFWPVAPRVRAFIKREQAAREKRAANLTALTGEPTA